MKTTDAYTAICVDCGASIEPEFAKIFNVCATCVRRFGGDVVADAFQSMALAAGKLVSDATTLAAIRKHREDRVTAQLLVDVRAALNKFNEFDYVSERRRAWIEEDTHKIPDAQLNERTNALVHALINGYRIEEFETETTDPVNVAVRR